MQNHLSDMFSVVAGLKAPASGKSSRGDTVPGLGSNVNSRHNDFLGFLRAFAGKTGSNHGRHDNDSPAAPVSRSRHSRLTRRQRAFDRIKDMAARGEIHARDLRELPENEWEKLETWVLDGAGGAYPPVKETSGGGATLDAGSIAASGNSDAPDNGDGAVAGSSPDSREALLALLADMQAETAGMANGITADGPSGSMTGMNSCDIASVIPVNREMSLALITELLSMLGVSAEDAASSSGSGQLPSERIQGMFGELQDRIANMTADELSDALGRALIAPGGLAAGHAVSGGAAATQAQTDNLVAALLGANASPPDADADSVSGADLQGAMKRISELPLAVLRAVAAKVLDAGMQENHGGDNSLLVALAADKELKNRLLAMTGDASDASSRDGVADTEKVLAITDAGESGGEETDDGNAHWRKHRESAGMMGGRKQTENNIRFELKPGHAQAAGSMKAATVDPVMPPVLPESVRATGAESSGLHASSAAAQPGAQPLTSISRATALSLPEAGSHLVENMQRVEQVMRMSVKRGISHVSLQLSPAELGQVTLRLKMNAGVVSATVEAENPDARHMLTSGLQQLRENLQVHGIELDSFDVFLTGGEAGEGQNQRWPKLPRRWRQHAKDDNETVGTTAVEPVENGRMDFSKDGSFDFIV